MKLGISKIEFLFLINCQETVDVCKELSTRAITVIFANCEKLVFGKAYFPIKLRQFKNLEPWKIKEEIESKKKMYVVKLVNCKLLESYAKKMIYISMIS